MWFPTIHQASDPEEYSWEVELGEGQELKQVDDQLAMVFYEDGHTAFSIAATPAHDAEGADVPTSLEVSGENIVTLTVHHRAGDPAVGGAPFHYPVVVGKGWEGGFSTVTVIGPPDEQQQREERERRQREEWEAALHQEAREGCRVPPLHGRSLKASRERLKNAGCSLGTVRGERTRSARVVKQDFAVGQVKPTGTRVSVKLG